jgi:hypothetical protein
MLHKNHRELYIINYKKCIPCKITYAKHYRKYVKKHGMALLLLGHHEEFIFYNTVIMEAVEPLYSQQEPADRDVRMLNFGVCSLLNRAGVYYCSVSK